jgi:hypothetical protein
MEATTTTTAAPTPVAPPPVAPAPAVMTETKMDSGSGNGSGNGSVKDIVKNLDWVQVGFGVLGSAALFYAIYYFRYHIAMNKTFVKNIENKIDDITIKIADINSVMNTRQQEQQENIDLFF